MLFNILQNTEYLISGFARTSHLAYYV